MAGNVTVSAGATVLGVLSASGAINGVPEFFPLGLGIIYKYANLTLPYSPNDPGLQYTYDNSANTPHVNLAARFFNLLNEPSTGVTFDAGSAAAGAATSGVQVDVGPDCLNVLDFGAIGDGVANDTAAIQCALDQAARNWNAQQSAISQGTRLANPGSTIVCIPSGYTFLVGGGFWQTPCGRAWGTNGNWPDNPYDVACANLTLWDSFFGRVGIEGFTGGGPALYVRSGVTVQLDGVLTLSPPDFETESTVLCIFDDLVLGTYQASAVTIYGSGTIDCGGAKRTYGGIVTGIGIYAAVSQNFVIKGITLKNSVHWGIQLFNNPVWPVDNSISTILGLGVLVIGPTVYSDADASAIVIDNVHFIDCSLTAGGQAATRTGCLYVIASGVDVTNCTFTRAAKFALWINGKGFFVDSNTFDSCSSLNVLGSQDTIMIGYIDSCTLTNNKILGGGTGGPGFPDFGGTAIRLMGNKTPLKLGINGVQPPAPNYPIDYSLNVQVIGNIVSRYLGTGFSCDYLPTAGQSGFYSSILVMNNTFTSCWLWGLVWMPTIWPYVGPGNIAPEGCNYAVDIGGNIYEANGEGISRIIFQPSWPYSIDLDIGSQDFSINTYSDIISNGMLGALPHGTSACGDGGGGSIFVGPFAVFPYPNVSTSGTWFVERCPRGAPAKVVTLSNGVTNYIPNDLVLSETPGGTVDGSNTQFTTVHGGITQLTAFVTGQIPGVTPATNFTNIGNASVTGSNTFTISPAPPAGTTLRVSYRFSTVEGYMANIT